MSLGFSTDVAGSMLLSEVLSHFSNVTSAQRQRAPKEPQLSAWTAPAILEQRRAGRNAAHRYLVHAADRGKFVMGRPSASPSPSPSPTFISEGAGQTGSRPPSRAETPTAKAETPVRNRLPKSAQQFPVLRESGYITSSMKLPDGQLPLSKQSSQQKKGSKLDDDASPAGDNKPLPFRHAGKPHLFGRHQVTAGHSDHFPPGNHARDSSHSPVPSSSTTSPVPGGSDRTRSHHGSMAYPPGHSRTTPMAHPPGHPGYVRTRSTTVSEHHVASKLLSTFKMAQFEDDDDHDEHKDADAEKRGLSKVALSSSKYERMNRLNTCRRLKDSELNLGDRDRVGDRDKEHARASLARNMKTKRLRFETPLADKLVAALNDFGIRAHTRQEKLMLKKVLLDHEYEDGQGRVVSFKDFCTIIEEVRVKLRSCRFGMIFTLWRTLDLDDVGGLDHTGIMQLLTMLSIVPKSAIAGLKVAGHMDELHKDSYGLFPLSEAEHLIQRCREDEETDCRRRQRDIEEEYFFMSHATFTEFRSQILDLHEIFMRLDVDNSGKLEMHEIMHLLAEFGICTGLHTKEIKDRMEQYILDFLVEVERREHGATPLGKQGDTPALTFQWFLIFVKTLRKKNADSQRENVTQLFQQYDKDKSGSLDMKEVCKMIHDLDLQPRTPQEQEAIAELLEASDADGSGTFTLDELSHMMVRIQERRAQILRDGENARAEALNLTRHQKYELRRAFETLDLDGGGTLEQGEIVKAVQMMQWKVTESKISSLLLEVDEDGTGTIDFIEFMELMARIDLEIKADLEEEKQQARARAESIESQREAMEESQYESEQSQIKSEGRTVTEKQSGAKQQSSSPVKVARRGGIISPRAPSSARPKADTKQLSPQQLSPPTQAAKRGSTMSGRSPMTARIRGMT